MAQNYGIGRISHHNIKDGRGRWQAEDNRDVYGIYNLLFRFLYI